jgi:hypothetical protein
MKMPSPIPASPRETLMRKSNLIMCSLSIVRGNVEGVATRPAPEARSGSTLRAGG